jgi:glycerate kinase
MTVARAIAGGLRAVWPDVELRLVPMADGGDGTVEAFLAAGAQPRTVRVRGPLGAPVDAVYARDGERAIIEMAAASGLALLAGERDALRATTYGTGELIRDALDGGARSIVLGIGGSATTDGGAGGLAALGVRFLDERGGELPPDPASLQALARIDVANLDPRLAATRISIACDVDNPLLGPHGAAAVYGPQKGAAPGDIAFLDGVLARLADCAERETGRDLRDAAGAGAAGGLGWALATFADAALERGVFLIARIRQLEDALAGASLCVTGEGRIDRQTLHGKVVDGVASLAAAHGVPVVAFGGSIDVRAEAELAARGISCMPIVAGPLRLSEAMRRAPDLLQAAATRFARLRVSPETKATTHR